MSRVSRFVLPSALALALAALASAQQPQPKAGQPAQERQQQFQQQRRAWIEAAQERNKKLDDLVAKMNAAKGEAKVDAIAAVINEMMEQRKAMTPHPGMGGPMGAPMMPAPSPEGGAK